MRCPFNSCQSTNPSNSFTMKDIKRPTFSSDPDLPSGSLWEHSLPSETSQEPSSCPICAIHCTAESATANEHSFFTLFPGQDTNFSPYGILSDGQVGWYCRGWDEFRPLKHSELHEFLTICPYLLKKCQSNQEKLREDDSCSEGKKDTESDGGCNGESQDTTTKSADYGDSMSSQRGSSQQQVLSAENTTIPASNTRKKVATTSLDELFPPSRNQSWADMAEEDYPNLFSSWTQSSIGNNLNQSNRASSHHDASHGFDHDEVPRPEYTSKEPISLIGILLRRRPDLWI